MAGNYIGWIDEFNSGVYIRTSQRALRSLESAFSQIQ